MRSSFLGQPIPIGRPYRTRPNGVLNMLTARKRVGPLPTHRLELRYSADYSSSELFTSYDSSRDSPSDSSSETSLNSHSDSSFDSSSRHSSLGYAISDSFCDLLTTTTERPLMIMDSDSVTDLEVSSKDGYESYVDIDECIAYADAIRARGADDRNVVETAAAEEVESSARGTIEVEVDPRVGPVVDYDVRESVREDVPDHVTTDGAVKVTYKTLGYLVQRFHDHAVDIPIYRIQVIESV
ncbi:hypothetical protein Tco_0693630 [Tanacetum coccineum]